MLKKIIKPTLFLASGGVLGWGGWSIYSSQTPKTLGELVNWKGYVLASFSDGSDNTWKAIYEENKEAIEKDTEITESSETENHKKIKAWCTNNKDLAVDQLPEGKLEKAILYCTNPKTVKGSLISQGKELVETGDEESYKVSATLFSKNANFVKLIAKSSESDTSNNGDKLKAWCEETLKKPSNSSDINLAGQWCLKQEHKTLKDRIKAKHKELKELSEGGGGDNGYEKKFEKKKNVQTFLDVLNKYKENGEESTEVINKNTEKTKGVSRLKKFCEDYREKKVWEIEDYFGTYSIVGTYCYDGSGDVKEGN